MSEWVIAALFVYATGATVAAVGFFVMEREANKDFFRLVETIKEELDRLSDGIDYWKQRAWQAEDDYWMSRG